MPKITKHVPVRRGFDTVWLKPGDDLPEWADGLVGDHALDSEAQVFAEEEVGAIEDQEPTPEVDPELETDAQVPESSDAPDFTKPVAAKRGRPRKAE